MLEKDKKKILNCSIESLTTYCNITGGAIEFGNGGYEIIAIPPGCE